MKNINELGKIQKNLELKANLNPEQREYLELLKDKMKKILGNKTKQELAKAGDLATLNKYKTILLDILQFLQTKEFKDTDENYEVTSEIVALQLRKIIQAKIDLHISESPFNMIKQQKLRMLQKQAQEVESFPQIWQDEDLHADTKVTFSVSKIQNILARIEGLDVTDLVLTREGLDADGKIIMLNFQKVGEPGVDYLYHLKYVKEKDGQGRSKTEIQKIVQDFDDVRNTKTLDLAKYDEDLRNWIL